VLGGPSAIYCFSPTEGAVPGRAHAGTATCLSIDTGRQVRRCESRDAPGECITVASRKADRRRYRCTRKRATDMWRPYR
jgi:hypothetical protein